MTEAQESLLEKENYRAIIESLSKKTPLTHNDSLMLGISYYKTNNFEKAETFFEQLQTEAPTSEITTYLIISKIKCNKLMAAMKLYESLCNTENENIIKFIEKKDYKNALNLTLFLKSIPLELPKKEAKSNDLTQLATTYNYGELSLKLAEKTKNNH